MNAVTAALNNPVVAQYVATDTDIRTILAGVRDDPVADAMALLHEFIDGERSPSGAFRAARAASIRGVDINVCILFLGTWAQASYMQTSNIDEDPIEAWTLVHRAKGLISHDTPPEISSYVELIESRLTGHTGNIVSQEQVIRSALGQLQEDSPRRGPVILELAVLLAQIGRLKEIDSMLNRIPAGDAGAFEPNWPSTVRFINSVETGRSEEAAAFVPAIQSCGQDSLASRSLERYRPLLELMRKQHRPAPGELDNADDQPDLPDWALVIHCLLTDRIHQSLRWARLCEKRTPRSLAGHDCMSFNLVRAELAERHGEAARRIMEIRRERGNVHYLDDFYLARIELLLGNGDAAQAHFCSLIKAVDSYDASDRLAFELRMAVDMPRDDLVRLARTSESISLTGATQVAARQVPILKRGHGTASALDSIIGTSAAMSSVRETILRFAELDVPVLVTGETGTGKELVARALHEAGPRTTHPFVAINCGAIADSLLESEMFGHEKGAFSGARTAHHGLFEEAGDGTILLDEIGEISPRLQVALLRVLETNEIRPVGSSKSRGVNCRILASTNADLGTLADEDRFRKDILFRLRRLEIRLPPLRDRRVDIPLLATHFLDEGRPEGIHAVMSADLGETLMSYSWPGNVRELRNSIEKMRLMNSDKLYYDTADLDIGDAPPADPVGPMPDLRLGRSAARPLDGTPETPVIMQPPRETRERTGVLQTGKSRVRRQAQLRDLFVQHRMLTRNEVIRTLDISPNTATQDLKDLCSDGFIERVKPSKSPRSVYFMLRE